MPKKPSKESQHLSEHTVRKPKGGNGHPDRGPK